MSNLTILRTMGGKLRLTKVWKADGSVEDYGDAKQFEVKVAQVDSITRLAEVLDKLASRPDHCIIRGSYVGDAAAERGASGAVLRKNVNFTDEAQHFLMLDVDGFVPANSDPVLDPEASVREFIDTELPPEFWGATCYWRMSSSAGRPGKEHLLKAHLWFWLQTPYSCAQLSAWQSFHNYKIDRAVFRQVQIHYTADPVFEPGVSDPIVLRGGVMEGFMDEVPLVIPDGLLSQARTRDTTREDSDAPDPRQKPGVIGAFCRAFTIEDLLEGPLSEVFEWESQGDARRLNFLDGGGSPGGAFVSDCREYIGNTHNSDPFEGRLANKWDLVRQYKFGHLDDPDDGFDSIIETSTSQAQMRQWALSLPEVQAELAAASASLSAGSAAASDTPPWEDPAPAPSTGWPARIAAATDFSLSDLMDEIKADLTIPDADREALAVPLSKRAKELGLTLKVTEARRAIRPETQVMIDYLASLPPSPLPEPAAEVPEEAIDDGPLPENPDVLDGETEICEPEIQENLSLADMRHRCVYIKGMQAVGFLHSRREPTPFATAFRLETAGSIIQMEDRSMLVADLWLRDPQRKQVDTVTFSPGRGHICRAPNGELAMNLWQPVPLPAEPESYQKHVDTFLDLVGFLVPDIDERRRFLDWLAHIEQQPGVLPHAHYLMYTAQTGIGRNLLASILARVWSGYTALGFDLVSSLESGYNGRISRKLLAVVDEISEGGNDKYRFSDSLKRFCNEEVRFVNPKYGRQYEERNCTRLLMFSNHESALPIDESDRRIIAIKNPEHRRDPEYYRSLYRQRSNPALIASVRLFLVRRDIGQFNPGEVAPMNSAKAHVIAASQSDMDRLMRDVVDYWPTDCVTDSMFMAMVAPGVDPRKFRPDHACRRTKVKHYGGPDGRVRMVRVFPRNQREGANKVYILRNTERWLTASPDEIKAEVWRAKDFGLLSRCVDNPGSCYDVLHMINAGADLDEEVPDAFD